MPLHTKLFAVRDALLSVFTQAVEDNPVAKVFAAPQKLSAIPAQFLLIGSDGGDSGLAADGGDGMRATQVEDGSGNGWRSEDGLVDCAAWAWAGSDIEKVQGAAQTLFEAAVASVYADRTLGGVLVNGRAEVTAVASRSRQTQNGPAVRVAFTVSYTSLITS